MILSIKNPISGKNKNIRDNILDKLIDSDVDITFETTEIGRNATNIISEQEIEPQIIILSGGDGTISEAVQGIHNMNFNSKLLIIPAGTTNEIASNLKTVTSYDSILEKLTNPELVETNDIDYGLISEEHTFTYSLSFGTFTDLTYKTPQKMKNILGYFAYLIYGFWSFRKIHKQHLTINYDDNVIEGNFTFGSITNSKTIGGIIDLKEQNPILDDGLFEVLLIKSPNTWTKYRDIVKSIKKKKYRNNNFVKFQASNMTIEFSNPIDINIDGEFGGTQKRISVKNINKSLRVIR